TPIMETPLNVQVISKQVLKDQQVITLADSLKNVSGVSMVARKDSFDNTAQLITLRGFASETYFRDGFRLQQGSSSRNMSNIESVEVLKGPAAILYGLVEPGGMVNVITKQPMATPYYALNQQFGSFSDYRTTVDATGPLSKDDSLLYRLNMSYQNKNSFREFVSTEDFFIAPVLKWNISSRTQATAEFEYNRQNLGVDNGMRPFLNGQLINVSHKINYGEYSPASLETFYGGFNWSHEFNDDWKLKHRVSINQSNTHFPASVFPFMASDTTVSRLLDGSNNQNNTYSTNIDLTGHFNTFGLSHTLLLGGDYYRLNSSNANLNLVDATLTPITQDIDIYHPVHTWGFGQSPETLFTLSQQTDQYGLYIQDQIKLPYDVHVMGGIRYQNIHQKNYSAYSDIVHNLGVVDTFDAQSDDAVTPRVGILWHPQNWLSLYANYLESFGANTGRVYVSDTQTKPVPATSAKQYEGGIKTEFYDGRLRANLAYFDLTKTNIATTDPSRPFQGFVIAAGAVQSRGYELDVTGEILPGWNAIATYSYTDAKIVKSFETDASGGSLGKVGSRYWGVPRNTASLWNTYEFQQGDLQGLKFGGGVTLHDGKTGCCDTPALNIPGYATLDLMTAYSRKVGKSKVTLQLNVNNLLDKNYYTSAYTNQSLNRAALDFGTPRSFMGSIGIQF
ncbi:MAG: TonB-dependent siderophore receptor, partial [Methylobacter sp.]|nr:TonB-dependent siderophore receptor [Methylobacter sp.]